MTPLLRRGFARAAVLACVWLIAPSHGGAQPLDPATHGRSAEPDYGRVFPQDRVTRLDLRVAAADWQHLVDDMTGLVGAFGAGVQAQAHAPELWQGAGRTTEEGGDDDVELLGLQSLPRPLPSCLVEPTVTGHPRLPPPRLEVPHLAPRPYLGSPNQPGTRSDNPGQ